MFAYSTASGIWTSFNLDSNFQNAFQDVDVPFPIYCWTDEQNRVWIFGGLGTRDEGKYCHPQKCFFFC